MKALDPDSGANLCFERIREHLATAIPEVEIETIRIPQTQQGYYQALQFGVVWEHNGRPFAIADGGFTTWTQQLSENRKERFLSSGIGLELLWKILHGKI